MKDSNQSKEVYLQTIPEISQEPRFRVRVVSCTTPEVDLMELVLTKPEGFVFSPGQYVWLVLPKRSKKAGRIDRRAYSICSAADESSLQFCIRLTHSDYLQAVKTLKKQDEVEIIGPMGSSFHVSPLGAIMISGGSGIAPFLSILKSHFSGTFSLLAYHSKDRPLPCLHMLESIVQKNPGHVVSILEGVPEREQLARIVSPSDARPIFISGPQGFVDQVNEECLALGIQPEKLLYEALYPTRKVNHDLYQMFSPASFPLFSSGESKVIKELPELGELFFMVVKQTSNHVIITDPDGVILFANKAAERMTGYSFHELCSQTPRLWGGMMAPAFYHRLWEAKSNGKSIVYEMLNRRKNGELYVALMHITPILRDHQVIAFVATEEDITEMKRLDKAKTEFIFLASHQLMTPLSAIGWYTEMLLAGEAGTLSSQQQKYLGEIQEADKRMVALIHALLNVSRIDMGTFKLSLGLVQLEDILHSVLRELEPSIQEKKLSIKHVCAKDSPLVHADPYLTRMIFQNLLSNAVKYTDIGGRIECSMVFGKEQVQISISDSGIGIPKAQQRQIFQKLFRADNAKKQDTQGTGLGLYIVKAIVDRSGGSIWFESEENKGTTFHISLPRFGVKKEKTNIL